MMHPLQGLNKAGARPIYSLANAGFRDPMMLDMHCTHASTEDGLP
jgi:hypothetical protein